MSSIFVLLLLLSVIALVVGLVRPSLVRLASRKRVGLVFGGLILFSGIVIGATSPAQSTLTKPTVSESNSVATTMSVVAPVPVTNSIPVPQKAATPTPVVDQQAADEAQLKTLTINALTQSAKTLGNKVSIRNVDVVPQTLATPPGGYGVFVEFNAAQSSSNSVIKQGIEFSMADVYIALYTSNLDVRTASVAAYLPLTDKYGNTNDGMVYKTMLDKTVANKVNWSADKSVLEWQVLPGVWTTTILNSSLNSQ